MPKWTGLTLGRRSLFDWVDLQEGETMADWREVWCDSCASDHTDLLDMEVSV